MIAVGSSHVLSHRGEAFAYQRLVITEIEPPTPWKLARKSRATTVDRKSRLHAPGVCSAVCGRVSRQRRWKCFTERPDMAKALLDRRLGRRIEEVEAFGSQCEAQLVTALGVHGRLYRRYHGLLAYL